MTLRKTTFQAVAKDFEVLSPMVVSKKGNKKTANVAFFAEFNYTPKPGFLYFTTRAISARVNRNYDGFPSAELKKGYKTFLGRPHFVNHTNHDPERARGDIVGSVYKENGKDKYIKLLIETDAKVFPRLAQEISSGNLDGVSMGVDVGKTICSFCNNVAKAPEDFCEHVIYMKGQVLERPNAETGKKEAVLVYETCYDLNFFEISSVFDPADETALVQEVMLPRLSNTKEAFGEATAPARVNTLREKGPCPQCSNEDFDGDQCKWCGYIAPPDELDDPDLGKAQEFDKAERQNVEDGPSEDDTDLDESTGSDTPDDLSDEDSDGVINPEEDQAEDFEGDPNDISNVGPGENDVSDDGEEGGDKEMSPLREVVHETIQNLEDLLQLNQVVQEFAQDSSSEPPVPADPFAGADLPPAAPDGLAPAPNDAMQDQIPPNAVPEAADVPPGQSADAIAAEPPPDTEATPAIPDQEVSPAPDMGVPGEVPEDAAAPDEAAPSDEEGVPPGAEDEGAPEEIPPPEEDGGQPDLVDQVEDLAEQVNQILEDLQGGDNGAGKEVSAMPTQAKAKTSPRDERAQKIADAHKRLKEMQDKLADLSRNEAPENGHETVGETPSPEPATDSTEGERNDETLTNVQDLDANGYATREKATKPDKRTNVEVPTVSIANKHGKARFTNSPFRTAKLTSKDIGAILARCDEKYASLDLGTALATVAREFASSRKVSAKNILTQLLIAANKRASELDAQDRKSLAAFSSAFIRQVKAADDDKETVPANDTTTASDDVLHYYDNGENLEVAKPDDRVDVEAPVANDTNDYAQSSQFPPDAFDNNAGKGVAKPDDEHTMNFPPGAKPKLSGSKKEASFVKASAVDAIKLAESYIELGVISPDLKFDKIAEFEMLPKVFVQQQQLTCDAVKRAQASAGTKPRGVVPRAATGHRPIPQMGRAATYSNNGSSASFEENLWAL